MYSITCILSRIGTSLLHILPDPTQKNEGIQVPDSCYIQAITPMREAYRAVKQPYQMV